MKRATRIRTDIKLVRFTKIRKFRHTVYQQKEDGYFQCVTGESSLKEHEWYYSEADAIRVVRERIDRLLYLFRQLPAGENPDQRKAYAAFQKIRRPVQIGCEMEEYSDWSWEEHVEWVAGDEVPHEPLRLFVVNGGVIYCDEDNMVAVAFLFDHVDAPMSLIKDTEYGDDE